VSEASGAEFVDALQAVAGLLADLTLPSMIIGGVAVIAHGVPRSTVDIDATILARDIPPEKILAAADRRDLRSRIDDAAQFARAHQVLLLRHEPSGIPVDVILAWLPFEQAALEASVEVEFQGVHTRVARPEDLIIYKLVAARPRDLDDAEALLIAHGAEIDVARLRRVIGEFAEALEDPGRIAVLETLLARAGRA